MLKEYTAYKCESCDNELILLSEEIDRMRKDRYIACPFCNSKKLEKLNSTDNLKECMSMNEHIYKRVKGAMKQIK